MTHLRKFILIDENGNELVLTPDGNVPTELYDSTGKNLDLTDNSNVPVETEENGHVCEDNSTSTPLGISGVFDNNTWQDTLNYNTIIIGVTADQDSATDGLMIEWSADGITVHDSDEYTISANSGEVYTFSPARRYLKLTYTNGPIAQTSFNIQTIFKKGGFKASSIRVKDTISGDDDAEQTKTVLAGRDQDDIYQNVRASEVGNLLVSDFLVEVSRGNLPGYYLDRKFGSVATIQATTPSDIWAFGVVEPTYTFSTTADIDSLSSDNSGDNGLDVTIVGLDTNYEEVSQTISLDGADAQTPVSLTTDLIRVNRAFNANGTDFLGNIYVFVSGGGTSGGVPNTTTDVRAYIPIGDNQTLQAIYTVPAGKTAYFMGLETSLTKAGGATAVGGTFKGRTRLFGKVFRTQDEFELLSSGNSNRVYNFPISLPFPEKTDFVPTVDVTSNGVGATWAFTILLIDN